LGTESDIQLPQFDSIIQDFELRISRQIALRQEFPLEPRVPNRLTARTLYKSVRNEEVETFDSLAEMEASWHKE